MRARLLSYVLLTLIIIESMIVGYKMPKNVEYPAVDPRLKVYLDSFVKDAKDRGIDIDSDAIGVMVFTNLPDNIAGFCNASSPMWLAAGMKHTAVVLIDQHYESQVDKMDDYTFKSLVYHELGHCLLYKGHDKADYLTIMTELPIGDIKMPYQKMSGEYKANWKDELDDLFYRPDGFPPPEEFKIP